MDALTLKRRATPGNNQIEPMLVASTGHVTEEEAKALDAGTHTYMPLLTRDEGWVFCVNCLANPDGVTPVSASLDALLSRASELGCDWLMLDRDAGAIEDIEVHNW